MMRDQAIELRKQGYSYKLITQKLGVSGSTLSYWLRDIPYTPNSEVAERIRNGPINASHKRTNLKNENSALAKREARTEMGILSNRDVFMLGVGLYIGEGSKSIESIRITNSDPRVIRLAMRWFRDCLGLEADNFSLILFLYPDVDEGMAKIHWSKVTGLPEASFKKSQVDARNGKKRANYGKLPFGTLQIRIKASGNPRKGVHLFRKIDEWMRIAAE